MKVIWMIIQFYLFIILFWQVKDFEGKDASAISCLYAFQRHRGVKTVVGSTFHGTLIHRGKEYSVDAGFRDIWIDATDESPKRVYSEQLDGNGHRWKSVNPGKVELATWRDSKRLSIHEEVRSNREAFQGICPYKVCVTEKVEDWVGHPGWSHLTRWGEVPGRVERKCVWVP